MNIIMIRTGLAAMLLGSVMFMACGGSGESMNAARTTGESPATLFEVERSEVESDLVTLRGRVDMRMKEVSDELERTDLSDEQRAALIFFREELQDRRNRLERARRDVEVSRLENWNSVHKASNATLDEIDDWFGRQGDRVDRIHRNEVDLMAPDGQ